jgi:hypothetical protein
MFITGSLNSATSIHGNEDSPAESDETVGAGLAEDDILDPDFIVQEEHYAVFVPQTELEIPSNLSSEQFLTDDGNYGINHFITCLRAIQENNE